MAPIMRLKKMSEFGFLNKTWDFNKVWSMVFGYSRPDDQAGDGYMDVPGTSWYQKSCLAVDKGDIEAMHDVIQIENALSNIPDPKAKAAVILAMHGWDFAEIGAAINDYRTGYKLVRQGVRSMRSYENRRAENE
jgi:hypothetical protein